MELLIKLESMQVIKYSNFIIILFVSSFCYSQHWMLTLHPYIGGPSLSTQRMEKVVMDENLVFSNGHNTEAYSFSDNVSLSGQYNLSLLANVYRFKNNWRLGVGFGVYNGSRAFLKAAAYNASNELSDNEYDLYGENILYQNTTYERLIEMGPVDFQIFSLLSKDLEYQLNTRTNQLHSFSFGLGVTNMKASYDQYIENLLGKITYKKYTSHNILPFCLLRYEVLFRTKQKKNLFSLALSYQQGFFKVDRMEMIDIYDIGPYYSQAAVSRGSSLYLSLSRPFTIYSSEKKSNSNKL